MTGTRPHVVIVGAGFGGLATARALARTAVDVTLIDQRNHHLFQPLLYQVATAALSPADIAGPIRAIVSNLPNVRVLLDRVDGVDSLQKQVALSSGRAVGYDWLVIATGARHSYFGRDEWAEHAPGIKTIDDATAVRRKVLLALERAETETDPDTPSSSVCPNLGLNYALIISLTVRPLGIIGRTCSWCGTITFRT